MHIQIYLHLTHVPSLRCLFTTVLMVEHQHSTSVCLRTIMSNWYFSLPHKAYNFCLKRALISCNSSTTTKRFPPELHRQHILHPCRQRVLKKIYFISPRCIASLQKNPTWRVMCSL
uniref:Uncharacterized protein n=1 Tax=Gasterosteus aculeatus TaxID=69293 RepID=G3PAC7_GASAC